MSTVPYVEDTRGTDRAPASERLIVAMSCNDPLRQRADWAGQAIDLTPANQVLVGRAEEEFQLVRAKFMNGEAVTLLMPDVHLSSEHLLLRRAPDDGRWYMRDAGSMNGVWVNGERITETVLADNDVIEAGTTILLFRDGTGGDPEPDDPEPNDPELNDPEPNDPLLPEWLHTQPGTGGDRRSGPPHRAVIAVDAHPRSDWLAAPSRRR